MATVYPTPASIEAWGAGMGSHRETATSRLQRIREKRRENARLRALFGMEHQGVLRELMELVQRTVRRRRVERS